MIIKIYLYFYDKMNYLRRMYTSYMVSTLGLGSYPTSCFTNPADFKKLIWINLDNGIDKAYIINKYLSNSNDTSYISKLLYLLNNEAMEDPNFVKHLVILDTHKMIFKKAKFQNEKWLMYSCFWNIFRHQIAREHLTTDFVKMIINDYKYVSTINSIKIYNVYFGCLSNISLSREYKEIICNLIINIKNIPKIKYILVNNHILNITVFGLIANICINHEQCNLIINCDFFKQIYNLKIINNIIENINISDKIRWIKNILAFFINSEIINREFLPIFIQHNCITLLYKMEKICSESDLVESDEMEPLFDNIKNNLNLSNFDDTTSLHLSHKYEYKNITYDILINDNIDINIKDYDGDTILHNAIRSSNFDESIFYIMCNADVNIRNNNNVSPMDLNTKFINNILNIKNNIHMINKKIIKTEIENENIFKYENGILDIINSYIDIRKDFSYLMEL